LDTHNHWLEQVLWLYIIYSRDVYRLHTRGEFHMRISPPALALLPQLCLHSSHYNASRAQTAASGVPVRGRGPDGGPDGEGRHAWKLRQPAPSDRDAPVSVARAATGAARPSEEEQTKQGPPATTSRSDLESPPKKTTSAMINAPTSRRDHERSHALASHEIAAVCLRGGACWRSAAAATCGREPDGRGECWR